MIDHDLVLTKIDSIQRCLKRIESKTKGQVESLELLETNGIISRDLERRLSKMVGFRNIAIHEYQIITEAVLEAILTSHLDDLRNFTKEIAKLLKGP